MRIEGKEVRDGKSNPWDPFYVKNTETSSFLSYAVILFLNQWQIPLLFLLAGASTWFALRFRNGRLLVRRTNLTRFLFGMKPLPKTRAPKPSEQLA